MFSLSIFRIQKIRIPSFELFAKVMNKLWQSLLRAFRSSIKVLSSRSEALAERFRAFRSSCKELPRLQKLLNHELRTKPRSRCVNLSASGAENTITRVALVLQNHHHQGGAGAEITTTRVVLVLKLPPPGWWWC